MGIESAAVPVHTLPDGREFITDEDCAEHPEVRAFVGRFSNYWTRELGLDGYVGPAKDVRDAMYSS